MNSPNFLTFPIIFDPFSGYENQKDYNKPLQVSQKEKIANRIKHPNDDKLFVSMVCHQIQIHIEKRENETNGTIINSTEETLVTNNLNHSLGMLIQKT